MTDVTIVPNPAPLLRELVRCAGFRPAITDKRLDKDLDDMAADSRPSSTGDLMLKFESKLREFLEEDCGQEFADFFRLAWSQTRGTLQTLVRNVDTSTMADDQGFNLVRHAFAIPMLSSFFHLISTKFSGPDETRWWDSPFSAWLSWSSGYAGVTEGALREQIMIHFDVDERSFERWQKGAPIEKIKYPYRAGVSEVIAGGGEKQIERKMVNQITAWLIIAISFQSLPSDLRKEIRSYRETGRQLNWTLQGAINELNKNAAMRGQGPTIEVTAPLYLQLTELVSETELDHAETQSALDKFKALISADIGLLKRRCQFHYDWLAAKFAARTGNKVEALELYNAAVDGVWWYGGPAQKPIVREALLYAVGVGDKVAAERYWDKTFLLGLNTWPKRPLDDQELRRLAMGFENTFYGQKAEERVPPRVEVILRNGPFTLTRQQIANPNRKAKFAEGRTRRTPLMDAVQQGTLENVRRLLDAGGDPNDFIPESGQGPLSLAMYRACNQKDPAVMEHLLSLKLSHGTVNRHFSTQRETPLKLAIEMANPRAVNRLIELGADIEVKCGHLPSALCYAVNLLYQSIYPRDPTQERAYRAGKGRADSYDAKDGAVLDADLAARRQTIAALEHASPRNAQIFDVEREYFARSADDRREVIYALLQGRADANRPYHVDDDPLHEWTPTLCAAQVGDLGIFEALVKAGGDPKRTLSSPSSVERRDALWIAIAYKRGPIVNWLMRVPQSR